MVNIVEFILEKKIIALLVFTIFSLILAVIITIYEKSKKQKQIQKKEISSTEELKRSISHARTPEEKLEKISQTAKDFLHKNYNISQKLEFYEIEKQFENKNKDIHDFCKLMVDIYYTNENITDLRLSEITHLLFKIINPKKVDKSEKNKKSFFSFSEKKEPVPELPKYQEKSNINPVEVKPQITPHPEVKHTHPAHHIVHNHPAHHIEHHPIQHHQAHHLVHTHPAQLKHHTEHKIIHGKDQDEKYSYFVHPHKVHHLKHHIKESKKKINQKSLQKHKVKTIKDESILSNFANNIDSLKENISHSYRNLLEKLKT